MILDQIVERVLISPVGVDLEDKPQHGEALGAGPYALKSPFDV
jgi:hypothetical protein